MFGEVAWILRAVFPHTLPGEVRRRIHLRNGNIIDVGCGPGKLMRSLRVDLNGYRVGLDVYLPDIRIAIKNHAYDDCILADARYLPLRDRSFDIVLCSEVIEHMNKDEGLGVVKSLLAISRNMVVITTPVGDYPQEGTAGNPFQEHKSSWMPSEMNRIGFDMTLVGLRNAGLRFGKMALPAKAFSENVVYPFMEIIAGLLVGISPGIARNMVCTKSILDPS